MKRAVYIGIALIVVGLCAAGIIDWRKYFYGARGAAYRAKRQATEDLQGAPAKGLEAAKICRRNLQQIQAAKREVVKAKGILPGGVIEWNDVYAALAKQGVKTQIRCPAGGKYTLNKDGTNATCSIGANGTPDPADDHVFRD